MYEGKFNLELTGWTHTRKYATGFLRAEGGDAHVKITNLSKARSYQLHVYQVVSQNSGTRTMKVNNGDAHAITSSAEKTPVWSGKAVADCQGSILLTFNNLQTGHVQFSGIQIEACSAPTEQTVLEICPGKSKVLFTDFCSKMFLFDTVIHLIIYKIDN